MRYRLSHRLNHTLDSIALTDIILNLFIFFFITFSIAYIPKTQSPVSVELPRAGAGASSVAPPLIVSLKSGEDWVYVGDRPVLPENVAEAVRALPEEQRAQGAVLRCDRDVSIERTLQALARLQEAGVTQVSVAARPAEP